MGAGLDEAPRPMETGRGCIGTVDKFQGQEAPLVIYSMTTSSHADAPRGMEFLYSLIVSMSRRHAHNASASWLPRRWSSKPIAAHQTKCNWPTPIVAIWNWPTRSEWSDLSGALSAVPAASNKKGPRQRLMAHRRERVTPKLAGHGPVTMRSAPRAEPLRPSFRSLLHRNVLHMVNPG